MPNFLFWNVNRRDIPGFIGNLARQTRTDVLILAECRSQRSQLLEALNEEAPDYHYAWTNCDHLMFFTRFVDCLFLPLFESNRISIRRLTLPPRQPILVVAVHLPSKMGFSADSQILESTHLSRMIDEVETREGHHRTILLGDLNMNPFEPGMVAARGGLHAVMNRHIAARDTRIVQSNKYKFFYNPMWNYLGDRCGTFYFENAEPVCYFWNIFDQVLLRPDLLQGFATEQVRILTEVRGVSLLASDGRPDKSMASDHLPVLLELNF